MSDEDEELPMVNVVRLPLDPWSIAGLHTLDSLTDRKAITTWNTGFHEWNGKVHLAPGSLSVVTGLPGSGKTHLWAQIWQYVVAKYGLIILVASFECAPKPYYRRYLREIWARCRESQMTAVQIADADRFIAEHYRFLVHPEETPTLEWLLEMADVAVDRHKCSIVHLDPWNRLESQRGPKETEAEYTGRCLRTVSVFSKDTNAHSQIVAHPAKRDARRRDIAPDLEDISGAMHWWNMPDQGFVVHRKELWTKTGGRCYDAKFFHRKARFEELGHPCALDIRFNPHTRVFESVPPEGDVVEKQVEDVEPF